MSARRRREEDRVPWLKVGPDPYMATCERCGRHEDKPELPTPIEAALKYFDYLMAKHEDCDAEPSA